MRNQDDDREDIESLSEDDDDEEFFRRQVGDFMKPNARPEGSFSFDRERERLSDRRVYAMEIIESELWLTNGSISDADIAELVCGGKMVKHYPFIELTQLIRDYHRTGKSPEDVHSALIGLPWLNETYKSRLECNILSPEEKQEFWKFNARTRNECAMRDLLEYATKKEYLFDPAKVIEIFGKYNQSEIVPPRKVSRMRTPDDVRRWMRNIQDQDAKRVKTSYMQINLYTRGGLKIGALYCVAAPTGGGKSIVLCWIAADLVARGYRILVISTEMLETEVHERINRCIADAHTNQEASLKVIAKMEEDGFLGYDVWCAEELSSTVAEIEQKAKESEYDAIIVDYGDKLSAGVATDGEYGRQGIIFSQLSRLAKRLNVPVIVASQQNREALKNPKGGMENIGDSMDKLRPLEMLFSIPYYDLAQKPHMRNQKNLTIQKNRNGIKDVELFFDIDYDAWRMSEPQYIKDCISKNKNLGPQEIYFKILEAQKELNKDKKNAVVSNDDKND